MKIPDWAKRLWGRSRTVFFKITGGRPMKNPTYNFTDVVSGLTVYHWHDQFGREWNAEGRWSLFRVKVEREKSPRI